MIGDALNELKNLHFNNIQIRLSYELQELRGKNVVDATHGLELAGH